MFDEAIDREIEEAIDEAMSRHAAKFVKDDVDDEAYVGDTTNPDDTRPFQWWAKPYEVLAAPLSGALDPLSGAIDSAIASCLPNAELVRRRSRKGPDVARSTESPLTEG